MDYCLDRKEIYNGINYTVISVLDNNLLLVVETEDLAKSVFPMKTVVIPDSV